MGMAASRPRAALYVWAGIPERDGARDAKGEDPSWTSEEFALELLRQTGVSVVPGTFFGPAGEGYVRVSVTAPTERIREAVQRLKRFATSLD